MEQQQCNNEVEETLPHDLIAYHILPRVPIKYLLQFKCVSKQWYSTISSSHFAHLYSKFSPPFNPSSFTQFLIIQNGKSYQLYSHDDNDNVNDDEIVADTYCNNSKTLFELGIDFDVSMPEKLNLIGSCNGLVCLASNFDLYFILWNPITGKYHKYSDFDLSIDFSTTPLRVYWGFGYVSNVDDYKIVRILELPTTSEVMVHVFSLKSNKWGRIADELYQDIISLKSDMYGTYAPYSGPTDSGPWLPFVVYSKRGVLVNETLYWIVSKIECRGRKIVAFDLVCEEFATVEDLGLISSDVYEDTFICNMGGCLSKFGVMLRSGGVMMRMLKSPGMAETILLSSDLHLKFCHELVGFTRTGMFFVVHNKSLLGLVDPSAVPKKYTPLITSERPLKSHIADFVPSLTLPYAIQDVPDGME